MMHDTVPMVNFTQKRYNSHNIETPLVGVILQQVVNAEIVM